MCLRLPLAGSPAGERGHKSMGAVCLMLVGCLLYGGLYALYTQKKSGAKAALGMWCLCILQAGCLGLLLFFGKGQ